jgi:hypothetical protein
MLSRPHVSSKSKTAPDVIPAGRWIRPDKSRPAIPLYPAGFIALMRKSRGDAAAANFMPNKRAKEDNSEPSQIPSGK